MTSQSREQKIKSISKGNQAMKEIWTVSRI